MFTLICTYLLRFLFHSLLIIEQKNQPTKFKSQNGM